jgi:CheY-like chemotaxis protein
VSTVLVVDDAQTGRELIALVVHAAGHRALTAGTGAAAFALAKRHKPSLIFLDTAAGGLATCRRLTRDPDTAAIPVVLVTHRHDWRRDSPGARDHVAKPWDSQQIEDLIRRYCQ